MALEYAHGAIQWLGSDVVGTNYTVSGLTFQPKGMRFWCVGIQNEADASSQAVNLRVGVGFATSISDRRCVGSFSQNTATTSNCGTTARNDSVIATTNGAGADDGLLDIDQVNSDGFRLRVDDQGVANLTVFWECWGGSDITVAACFDLAEPATATNVDVTVTGLVSGATDQVVLFAGCQDSNALNTALAEAAGLFVGAAKDTSNQWVCGGNSDDSSGSMDTDGWCLDGECIGMIIRAGAAVMEARAAFVQYNTDGFRVNYAERGVTGRKTVGLAMKGGQWAVGSYTIDGGTGSATATVSSLPFAPVGVSLAGRMTVEQASDATTGNNRLGIGCGSSTSSRQSMGVLDEDGTASSTCEIDTTIQYDQALSFPSTTGTLQSAYDINAINSDGFQIIVDVAGGVSSEWQGYLTFGSAPAERRSYVSFAEFETPSAPRRAFVSYAEIEVPTAPRRSLVSWAELETPNAPRRAQTSWAELETPDAPFTERRAQVSFAELETGNAPRRAFVSFSELEIPNAPRRALVSWAELQADNAPRRAQVSWAEIETDNAPRRAFLSFAELQVGEPPRRAIVSWAELQIPSFGSSTTPLGSRIGTGVRIR